MRRVEIDPKRIILIGKSLGGLLAPRAAAFEHRLAACIAIDGLYSLIPSKYGQIIRKAGTSLSEEQMNAFLEQEMHKDSNVHWAISQGMWTMQASSPFDCAQKMGQYALDGVVGQITCPTLVCDAEEDHAFAGQPRMLFEALRCLKTYLLFTADEGRPKNIATWVQPCCSTSVYLTGSTNWCKTGPPGSPGIIKKPPPPWF